jgi:hypothetical protein
MPAGAERLSFHEFVCHLSVLAGMSASGTNQTCGVVRGMSGKCHKQTIRLFDSLKSPGVQLLSKRCLLWTINAEKSKPVFPGLVFIHLPSLP